MNKAIRKVMRSGLCGGLVTAIFVVLIIVVCAESARAQGSRKDDVVFNAQGRPMAGATVRVCTSTATGQPCSPLALIYSDAALTQALANPLSTDGLGNYMFYAAPGRYMIELSGPGITTKQLSNVILPSDPSSPTFTTVTTTSGISAFSLSLAGNLTVNGSTAVVGSLTVGGAPVPSTNQDNQWGAAQRFQGPIPWRDVTAYGASGSNQSTTTSGTFNSTTLSLTSALDFKNGQGLRLSSNIVGDVSATSAPAGLAVAAAGTTGATSYQYQVACVDSKWGESAASSVVSISNGGATLMYAGGFTTTSRVHVSWSAGTGCIYYAVYGRTSGGMTLLGITPNHRWEDYGQANMDVPSSVSATPPASAQRGYYYGKIVSGAGTTTLIMDTAPGTSIGAGAQIHHDDSDAIQSAITAAATPATGFSAGTQDRIYFPPGSYNITKPLSITGVPEMIFDGANRSTSYLLGDINGVDMFLVNANNNSLGWHNLTFLPSDSGHAIRYPDAAVECLKADIDHVASANNNAGGSGIGFFRSDVNVLLLTMHFLSVGNDVNIQIGEPANALQLDDIRIEDSDWFTGSNTGIAGTFQFVNVSAIGSVTWIHNLIEGPVPAGSSFPWFRLGGGGGTPWHFKDVEFAPEITNSGVGAVFQAWPGIYGGAGGPMIFENAPLPSIGTGGIFDWSASNGVNPMVILRESSANTSGATQIFKALGDTSGGLTCENSNLSPTQTLFNTNGPFFFRNCGGVGVSGETIDRIDYAVGTTNDLIERNDSVGNHLFHVENGGAITAAEAAAPSGAASFDKMYADSTAHRWKMKNNNGTAMTVSGIIASGTAALGTSSISSGACATVVTVSATGVLTTDTINYTPNADISGVTGYGSVNGPLTIYPYPTADNVNFKVCNWSAISYTPGAVTLNWKVIR